MPIRVPGKRDRHNKLGGKKRSVVAILSLTAMVDMFTVLVVFLLQNYATTGQVIEIPEGVELPSAAQVKELKPTNVVIISDKEIKMNNTTVALTPAVKSQQDWMVEALKTEIEKLILKGQNDKAALTSQIRDAVERIKTGDKVVEPEVDQFRRMTIQADKKLDFLTLKKIMYTVTEAGIIEINFAVLKESPKEQVEGVTN
jgi:biopolymer transport protein ExbD